MAWKIILGASIFWSFLFLARKIYIFLKGSNDEKKRQHEYNLSLSFGYCSFETNAANLKIAEIFNPSVRWKREYLGGWFSIGIYAMGMGQVLAFALSLMIFISRLMQLAEVSDWTDQFDYELLSWLVVDPSENIVIFWIGTLLVLLVHEIGHASAASMERLCVQGIGFFFAFLFPGAYVRIEDSINYLSPRAQLRIYSAGVWNNLALASILFTISSFGPPVLSHTPLKLNSGVMITEIRDGSPLDGLASVGDVILSINGHPLTQPNSLESYAAKFKNLQKDVFSLDYSTLDNISKLLNIEIDRQKIFVRGPGFCTDVRYEEYSANLDCCRSLFSNENIFSEYICGYATKQDLMCISPRNLIENSVEYLRAENLKVYGSNNEGQDRHQRTTEISKKLRSHQGTIDVNNRIREGLTFNKNCFQDSDCANEDSVVSSCVRPITLFPSAIMELTLKSKKTIMLQSHPKALVESVKFTQFDMYKTIRHYVPRAKIVKEFFVALPSNLYVLIEMSAQLSFSIAFANMLPAKYLDGGLAFPQFSNLLFSREYRHTFSDIIVSSCTIITILNILLFLLYVIEV